MRVLVAYGSKMGGTKGLAEMVGKELESNGFHVDVMPARTVHNVAPTLDAGPDGTAGTPDDEYFLVGSGAARGTF